MLCYFYVVVLGYLAMFGNMVRVCYEVCRRILSDWSLRGPNYLRVWQKAGKKPGNVQEPLASARCIRAHLQSLLKYSSCVKSICFELKKKQLPETPKGPWGGLPRQRNTLQVVHYFGAYAPRWFLGMGWAPWARMRLWKRRKAGERSNSVQNH